MDPSGSVPPRVPFRVQDEHAPPDPPPVQLAIAPQDLAFARRESQRSGMDVGSVLLSYGLVSAEDYCRRLSRSGSLDYLQGPFLDRAAAVCDPSGIAQIARAGRIPASWDTTGTRYAAVLPSSQRGAHPGSIAGLTTRQELGDSLRNSHRRYLSKKASEGLARNQPEMSAARRMTWGQIGSALSIALGVAGCAYATPAAALATLIIVFSCFFLSVITLRCLVLWPPSVPVSPELTLRDAELPTYSVLVPLYGEANMVPQLLDALCALDYPALGSKRTND